MSTVQPLVDMPVAQYRKFEGSMFDSRLALDINFSLFSNLIYYLLFILEVVIFNSQCFYMSLFHIVSKHFTIIKFNYEQQVNQNSF